MVIKKSEYKVIGVMSGTSLDGLDMVCCLFRGKKGSWEFQVIGSKTYHYNPNWKRKLEHAFKLNDQDLEILDYDYAMLIAKEVREFTRTPCEHPDLISSHGHTVFHEPARGITMQLGCGTVIASLTGCTCISDFRKTDVALGGQGAPLVPVGDELLFGEYDYCLNLGGFCNISWTDQGTRYAFDVSPCNIILNHLSGFAGNEFDSSGTLASSGRIDKGLLTSLNSLGYYKKNGPKSLGREWFESVFLPLFSPGIPVKDLLRTACEHISHQISLHLKCSGNEKVLVTGGGAHNDFLIELLGKKTSCQLVIPDNQLIDYKEAIVFAFLGLLRYLGRVNCLASVTGARADSSCGEIHQPAR